MGLPVFAGVTTLQCRKLGYVALNVTDVARSRKFYEEVVGLQGNGEGPHGEVLLRLDQAHHAVVLSQADTPGFKRFGWQLENAAQFDVLAAGLARHGVALNEVDADESTALGQGRSVRFIDPFGGATWEFYVTMQDAAAPFTPGVTDFDRLGHIVLKTDRFDQAIHFYQDALNFLLSDIVPGRAAFLRPDRSRYHHMLAITRSSRPALHHVNFMLPSIDAWGSCIARLPQQGAEVVWGPGRHPNADSYFLYFLDPDGLTLEYGFGMEEFPETGGRAPNIVPPGTPHDLWGSRRDPRNAAVGEIERVLA